MRERGLPLVRLACVVLAALVIYQLAQLLARKGPLDNFDPSATFAALDATNAPMEKPAMNTAPATNAAPATRKTSSRSTGIKPSDLPPATQARVDRITQSEIFGAVIRPLPMALIGIAGRDVLLRTASGQTGLLREGEELGGVKLLRIGTNRVLIEHEQQQKELTVFSGVGGETLLPKGEKNPQ